MTEPLVLHMPEPTPPPKPSRGSRLLPLMLALLLLLGGALAWLYTGTQEASGRLHGQYLPIAPLMTAKVTEVLVTPGQMVRAGQPLARLDGSGLSRLEADARALVRGARSSMEDTAARVAAAQAAEEYTVQRVALARHEEEALRRALEQQTHEHARAQLHMRNLDARGTPLTAQTRRDAQLAEEQARQRKEAAADAHENASRARAAVEGELRRSRQEAEKARAAGYAPAPAHDYAAAMSGASTASGTPGNSAAGDPTVITAPQNGRLLGAMPMPGQVLNRGEAVLHLAPDGSSALWALARISPELATQLRPGLLCLVIPHGMDAMSLVGVVEEVAGVETDPGRHDSVPLRIRITESSARALSAQVAEQPARVVIWGNAVPGLQYGLHYLTRWGVL